MDKFCPGGSVSGKIKAPASKSYVQRAVAAALLCDGVSVLRNMELCNDIAAALDVAGKLGAGVASTGKNEYTITGCVRDGSLFPPENVLSIGESGLSARMFAPIASLSADALTITGVGSIMKRPFDMMTIPLRNLGVEIRTSGGYLPVTVKGPLAGGRTSVDGSLSSQFITGLLMALPLAQKDTMLEVKSATSKPYIDMTIGLLSAFGITVENDDYKMFHISARQKYKPCVYEVEGDWSGASCLLVAGAIAGEVTVESLNGQSLQADSAILEALSMAGAQVSSTSDSVTVSSRPLRGFRFDATDCPDLFPALVALAANCSGKTILKGTTRLGHKESDRALSLQLEFGKMGIQIDSSTPDIMVIEGGQIREATVSSHNDHRIAMALAVAALRSPRGMTVQDAGAVNKSYPGFWADLDAVRKDN